jgi:hypothetical protein
MSGEMIQSMQALTSSQVLDVITIPASNTTVTSNIVLASNTIYTVRLSGTWVWGGCDGRYCPGGRPEYLRWGDAAFLTDDYFHSFADSSWSQFIYVEINGLRPSLNSYNANHVYTTFAYGTGAKATFHIHDCQGCYGDNAGSLRAEIIAGPDNGVVALGPLSFQQRSFPGGQGQWGADLYGDPNRPNPSSSDTIERWGCFLSSWSMMLDYYGHMNNFNVHTNPRELNNWLRQNNGFGGYNDDGSYNGKLVILDKVIEYGRKVMGLPLFPYVRRGHDTDRLNSLLEIGTPVILGVLPDNKNVPGHYILAVGETNSPQPRSSQTWYVNDPYYNNLFSIVPTLNDSRYNNAFTNMTWTGMPTGPIRYASITIYLASPAELLITDPQGRKTGLDPRTNTMYDEIPDASYLVDGLSPEDGVGDPLHPIKSFHSPFPIDGNYIIQVIGTGEGIYNLDFLNYNDVGDSASATVSRLIEQGKVDTFSMSYFPATDTQVTYELITNQPPLLTVPGEQAIQYSDSLSFNISATDPNDPSNTLKFSATGLPNNLVLTDNGDGTATISGIANVAPNTYTTQITVTDPGGLSDTKPVDIVVTKEDTRTTYTGPLMVSTGCATCSMATIPLRATIQDITAVLGDPAHDPEAGNITNATVSFVDRNKANAVLCTANVILLDPANPTIGTATCNWTANIGSSYGVDYTIGTIVNGYYTRDSTEDDVVVVVSKPTSNFITGGGYFINQKSGGTYAGDVGLKTNFGLNIKFTQKLTNLQGRVTIIVRQGGHVYQIKSTALSSLVVVPFSPSNAKSGTAELVGKATVTDVTDPLNPIALAGNATLNIVMKDNGEPGSADLIGISLWSKDGKLLFSSNWSGTKTVQQLLNGGNLSVK